MQGRPIDDDWKYAPQEVFDYGKALQPIFNPAIKTAEGNPNNFGVLSEAVNSPAQANRVLNNSIMNNFVRWSSAGRPGKLLDFMQQRWAPIGAKNDPKNLNANWSVNVRKKIKKMDPDVYEQLKRLNLVEASPWSVLDADPNAMDKIDLKALEWGRSHPRSYGWNNSANV